MIDQWRKKLQQLGKSPLGAFAVFTLLGYLRPALSILLLPLYLMVLEASEYGILALINASSAVLVIFATWSLDAAMRTFYFDHNSKESTLHHYLSQLFSVSLYISILGFGLFLLLGPWLFSSFFRSNEVAFFPLGALGLGTACMGVCSNVYFIYLRNGLKLKEFAGFSIVGVLLSVSLQVLFLFVFDLGVLGILGAYFLSGLTILVWIIIRHPRLVVLKLDRALLAPSFRFVTPLIPMLFLLAFEQQIDRFVLERYLTLEKVGIYALLMSLLGLSRILFSALDNAIRPFLYESLKPGNKQREQVVQLFQSLYLFINLMALSVIIAAGTNLHWFTNKASYLSAGQYVVLGAISFFPLLFVRYYALIFVFYKKSGNLSLITLVKVAAVFLLMVALVPAYGISGAFIALFISNLVNMMIFWYQARRFSSLKLRLGKSLIKAFPFFLFGCLCLFWTGDLDWAQVGGLQLLLLPPLYAVLFRKELGETIRIIR